MNVYKNRVEHRKHFINIPTDKHVNDTYSQDVDKTSLNKCNQLTNITFSFLNGLPLYKLFFFYNIQWEI